MLFGRAQTLQLTLSCAGPRINMFTARKLTLGRSLQQLRQVWIDAGQMARNRITGAIRPGLPPEDHHLVQRQIDACLRLVSRLMDR